MHPHVVLGCVGFSGLCVLYFVAQQLCQFSSTLNIIIIITVHYCLYCVACRTILKFCQFVVQHFLAKLK